MTQRERLLAVFERRPLDHLPWVPDLTYWVAAQQKKGCLPPRFQGPGGQVALHRDVHACMYYGWGASPAVCTSDGVKVTSRQEGDNLIERIECDGRALEMHRRWLPESYCHAITKYYVTEASQLAFVRELVARRRYAPNPQVAAARNLADADGIPITAMPRSPLPALLADWVGVEGTVFLLADATAEVEKTLAAIDQANDGFFRLLGPVESRVCHFCDNLSAEIIGGYWDRYCADYYRRRVAQVHQAGNVCVTHLDGATKALIPRLLDAGLDGIESLTPQPVGDISMEEMSRLLAPADAVFWGGLPGAMFAPPFSWPHLRAMLDRLFRLHRQGQRLIVASADQVPPDATLDDVRRVGEYLQELGC